MSSVGVYLLIAFVSGAISLIYAASSAVWVSAKPEGNERMKEIAKAIRDGAMAFLSREYRTISYVAVVIFIVMWALGAKSEHFGFLTAIGYLVGASLSALAGYIGMVVAVKSNVRTAEAARHGLSYALNVAFRGGSVTGFLVAGFGILAVAGFYMASVYLFGQPVEKTLKAMIGLAFGTSLISVFARLGGGIYTKAADVGADLVGKVEAGIPEDDPRNPAVIADNVGDNVGDCAGMAADVFESFTVTLVASMILGHTLFDKPGSVGLATMFPLVVASLAIVSSVIGVFFARIKDNDAVVKGFYKALGVTFVISLIVTWFAANKMMHNVVTFPDGSYVSPASLFLTAAIGEIIAILLLFVTDFFTSERYSPVKSIADASRTGHATNIIAGIAVGLKAPVLPAIIFIFAIYFSYILAGLYGIAIAAASMLSLSGIIISIDSYGPISDNAGGIAEMADLPENVRATTDVLDSAGNTTKAVTKGFAIGSAVMAALVLFAEYVESGHEMGLTLTFNLTDPIVIIGLLAGAMMPFYFTARAMEAVGVAAGMVVNEVRRQFKEIKGIMDGTAKPEYSKAVDIVTKVALKEMIVPGLMPVVLPIIVYILFGPVALGALSVGVIITGLFLAIFMTTGGGAWDNAKKLIETGLYGGKGSEAHKAAITGDTVGDPLKDTAGPAINPMIKVTNIIAILILLAGF
ncbi:MAG: K(+)-insensitive pyrophosphate-energized proton pump [bacterium]|nr:MAG: K(+)-insensitive pyrophosphate-energized proton pump [bacterium]